MLISFDGCFPVICCKRRCNGRYFCRIWPQMV